jgi:ClpP class serine protease
MRSQCGSQGARKSRWSFTESLAASGGYYVSGGKFLMANETTITGSTASFKRSITSSYSIRWTCVRGFQKRQVQGYAERRTASYLEERELVQSFIMKIYDKFLGIVAKERTSCRPPATQSPTAESSGKDALNTNRSTALVSWTTPSKRQGSWATRRMLKW